ncbi:carotenoid oxygenase family protein [Prochlorococcus marinus]|uniref:carotenoid oxygenase family protein n=1 Tax=Prochlorococcus marinus TaxID=1219 RepID=UPI0022B376E4|nr:carotenoid oxygenase family protein [Prochlorococcus marinus]
MAVSYLKKDSSQNEAIFSQEDWSSAYCNVEKELNNAELKLVKGSIPKQISGTFYRNGPGRLERGGRWVHHPFDGDGMIAAFKFDNGKIKITNRFVRTKEWKEEEKSQKFLYRGVFGTQKEGGLLANAFDIRLKNIANTHVIKLGNDLLALWEASSPYSLNPITLETNGISDLNGVLKKGEAFSAHPRFDPGHHKKERMVTFGVNTGPKSTIRLMEFSSEGEKAGSLLSDRKDSFNGFAFLHDFAITPNWAIFLQNAISFNPLPFLLGQKGAAQCLASKPDGNPQFLLIPRDCGKFAGAPPKTVNAPKGFVFHHLNAWEENEKINVESIFYDDFPSIGPDDNFRKIDFDLLPEGILKRCEINPNKNTFNCSTLSKQCCEFAMVNPYFEGLKSRFSWMATAEKKEGNGPLQAIKKFDSLKEEEISWSAAPRGFVSEPIFIPSQESKSEEDNGWVVVLVWNSIRSGTDLIILDSKDLTEKAILEVPISIPHGLHGSWVEN